MSMSGAKVAGETCPAARPLQACRPCHFPSIVYKDNKYYILGGTLL